MKLPAYATVNKRLLAVEWSHRRGLACPRRPPLDRRFVRMRRSRTDARTGNVVEGRSVSGNDEPIDGSYTSIRAVYWNTYLPIQTQVP